MLVRAGMRRMTRARGGSRRRHVGAARRLIHGHVRLASLLVALALCVKLLVPTGFMPVMTAGAITILSCPDAGPVPSVAPKATMAGMAMSGAGHGNEGDHSVGADRASAHPGGHGSGHDERSGESAQAGMPCAFAGLAAPSLAAVDPVVLAIAVAGMLATVFRLPARGPARAPAHLRPPLRGPPARF